MSSAMSTTTSLYATVRRDSPETQIGGGCSSDQVCEITEVCTNRQWLDACVANNPCASNAECYSTNHYSACRCPPGLEGDRYIPTCSASEWSAELIKTVSKTWPVSPRDVSTLVYMKTPVLPPPLVQWRCRMRPGVPGMIIVLMGRRVSTDSV